MRRLPARPLAFAFALALLAPFVAAGTEDTFDPKGTSPIVEGGGPGAGWVALEVSMAAHRTHVEVVSYNIASPGHAAIAAYAPNGRLAGMAQVINNDGRSELVVDGAILGDPLVETSLPSIANGWGAAVRFEYNSVPGQETGQTARLVLLASGGARWAWAVRSAGPADVASVEGDAIRAYGTSDFRGAADVIAAARPAGAHVAAASTLEVRGHHTIVGTFHAGILAASHAMRLDVDGTSTSCHCSFGSARSAGGFAPGATHVFHLTGGGAGMGNMHQVFVAAADVPIPWGSG
ncbi:MAG TPA: hypothetical protein VM889_03560 [Candidatus Thermoplasmatota archaeon]|nr:hypothetical protein [Candidatus Thermoplasmatota archaeon]